MESYLSFDGKETLIDIQEFGSVKAGGRRHICFILGDGSQPLWTGIKDDVELTQYEQGRLVKQYICCRCCFVIGYFYCSFDEKE